MTALLHWKMKCMARLESDQLTLIQDMTCWTSLSVRCSWHSSFFLLLLPPAWSSSVSGFLTCCYFQQHSIFMTPFVGCLGLVKLNTIRTKHTFGCNGRWQFHWSYLPWEFIFCSWRREKGLRAGHCNRTMAMKTINLLPMTGNFTSMGV